MNTDILERKNRTLITLIKQMNTDILERKNRTLITLIKQMNTDKKKGTQIRKKEHGINKCYG